MGLYNGEERQLFIIDANEPHLVFFFGGLLSVHFLFFLLRLQDLHQWSAGHAEDPMDVDSHFHFHLWTLTCGLRYHFLDNVLA